MNSLKFITAIMVIFLVFSCESDQDARQNQFEKSKKSWQVLKSENNESYRYQVSTASWTGYSSITTISVLNGAVTKREFESYNSDNQGGKELVHSYVEVGEEIGADVEGADPLTLDELYDICKKEYLTVDSNTNTVYFTEFDNGLVQSCGYVPNNCVDDCFRGFTLSIIEWID